MLKEAQRIVGTDVPNKRYLVEVPMAALGWLRNAVSGKSAERLRSCYTFSLHSSRWRQGRSKIERCACVFSLLHKRKTATMKKLFAIGVLLIAGSVAGGSYADDIALGQPGYGGTGCPDGTASVTLSPDAKSLSILFDEYYVEAGGATNKSFNRKSCNIAIPVHVPQGLSVSVLNIDYRGYNSLPKGATSTFNVEYFFAGTKGPKFSKTFNGSLDKDYLITNKLKASAMVWSRCGADVNLRTNSSIRVRTKQNKEALATVDSQDIRAAIVYKLQWKKC